MTSLNNINIDSNNVVNDIKEEIETTEEVVVENITTTKKVKNQEIELPPKK
jgi:hypothetical protein